MDMRFVPHLLGYFNPCLWSIWPLWTLHSSLLGCHAAPGQSCSTGNIVPEQARTPNSWENGTEMATKVPKLRLGGVQGEEGVSTPPPSRALSPASEARLMKGVDSSPAALRRTLVSRGKWSEHTIKVLAGDLPKPRPPGEEEEGVFTLSTSRTAMQRRAATAAAQRVRHPRRTSPRHPHAHHSAHTLRNVLLVPCPSTPMTCPGPRPASGSG